MDVKISCFIELFSLHALHLSSGSVQRKNRRAPMREKWHSAHKLNSMGFSLSLWASFCLRILFKAATISRETVRERHLGFNPCVLNADDFFASAALLEGDPRDKETQQQHRPRKSNMLFPSAFDRRCAYWCTSYVQKVAQKADGEYLIKSLR